MGVEYRLRWMMRTLAGVLVTLFLLSGCTDSESDSAPDPGPGLGSADCNIVVRFDGGTYYQDGWAKTPGEVVGQAEMSSCSDTGADAIGVYFPENPDTVSAYSVDGKDEGRVIAIEDGDGGYRLMRIGPSID